MSSYYSVLHNKLVSRRQDHIFRIYWRDEGHKTNTKSVMKWGRSSGASEKVPENLGCAVREERVDPNGTDKLEMDRKGRGWVGPKFFRGPVLTRSGEKEVPSSESRSPCLIAHENSRPFIPCLLSNSDIFVSKLQTSRKGNILFLYKYKVRHEMGEKLRGLRKGSRESGLCRERGTSRPENSKSKTWLGRNERQQP